MLGCEVWFELSLSYMIHVHCFDINNVVVVLSSSVGSARDYISCIQSRSRNQINSFGAFGSLCIHPFDLTIQLYTLCTSFKVKRHCLPGEI